MNCYYTVHVSRPCVTRATCTQVLTARICGGCEEWRRRRWTRQARPLLGRVSGKPWLLADM
jgi:hypothetical protein